MDKYKGNSLWLADDTTLIANSIESMKTNIAILKEAAGKYGLEIDEKKKQNNSNKRNRETKENR